MWEYSMWGVFSGEKSILHCFLFCSGRSPFFTFSSGLHQKLAPRVKGLVQLYAAYPGVSKRLPHVKYYLGDKHSLGKTILPWPVPNNTQSWLPPQTLKSHKAPLQDTQTSWSYSEEAETHILTFPHTLADYCWQSLCLKVLQDKLDPDLLFWHPSQVFSGKNTNALK